MKYIYKTSIYPVWQLPPDTGTKRQKCILAQDAKYLGVPVIWLKKLKKTRITNRKMGRLIKKSPQCVIRRQVYPKEFW